MYDLSLDFDELKIVQKSLILRQEKIEHYVTFCSEYTNFSGEFLLLESLLEKLSKISDSFEDGR